MEMFLKDRTQPILKDHILLGKLNGKRSFSIGGDLRIIYSETKTTYIFELIGTHNQVYE